MDCKNVVVFDDTNQIISHLVCRGFVKDYTVWTKHGEGSSAPYTTEATEDERCQFVHGTHPPLPQSEHVMPNVTDHGYCGGSEHDRTHVLPNVKMQNCWRQCYVIIRIHRCSSRKVWSP
jgi:hypothetical protein